MDNKDILPDYNATFFKYVVQGERGRKCVYIPLRLD